MPPIHRDRSAFTLPRKQQDRYSYEQHYHTGDRARTRVGKA
jgi:hypothetical protein